MKLRVAVFINLIMLLFIISAQESVLNDTVWEIADFLELDGIVNVGYDIAKSNIGKTIVYKNNKINIDNSSFNITKVSVEIINEELLWKETAGSSSRPLTFKDLGIKEDEVKVITIKTEPTPRPIGSFLFVISDKAMVSMKGGIYYILKRKE